MWLCDMEHYRNKQMSMFLITDLAVTKDLALVVMGSPNILEWQVCLVSIWRCEETVQKAPSNYLLMRWAGMSWMREGNWNYYYKHLTLHIYYLSSIIHHCSHSVQVFLQNSISFGSESEYVWNLIEKIIHYRYLYI